MATIFVTVIASGNVTPRQKLLAHHCKFRKPYFCITNQVGNLSRLPNFDTA